MEAIFIAILSALPATAIVLVSAVVAFALHRIRADRPMPRGGIALTGTLIPAMAIAYGLYLAWPWPWWQPNALRDGIPPGPWLIYGGLLAWPFCLLTSRVVLRRR